MESDHTSAAAAARSVQEMHELKIAKSRAKAAFTSAKHLLLDVTDSSDDKTEIRSHKLSFEGSLKTALDVLADLCAKHVAKGNIATADKLQDEMEQLESEFAVTMTSVQQVLTSSQHESSSNRSSEELDPEVSFNPRASGIASTPGRQNSQPGIGQESLRQLKRVSIPMFSGDKRLYAQWKAAFMACVDSAPISPEFKLLQLRQYLTGEAAKAIEQLGHSAASYEAAKERLERKFGGTRRHIANQMAQIDEFRPIRERRADDINKFADLLDITVINIKEAERTEELGYGSLYLKLIKKLSEPMIAAYQRWIHENRHQETVETLREWVNQEAEFQMVASETIRGMDESSTVAVQSANSHRHRISQHQTAYFGDSNANSQMFGSRKKCEYCLDNHRLWTCSKFKEIDVPHRWEFAKQRRLCFRCLDSGHTGQTCTWNRICGLQGCSRLHHRLLHQSEQWVENSYDRNAVASTQSPFNEAASHHAQIPVEIPSDDAVNQTQGTTLLVTEPFVALRTVPVILRNGDRCLQINALLDDGSTKSYINSDVAAELGLSGHPQHIAVNVLNGKQELFSTQSVEVQLESTDGAVKTTVTAFTTMKVTGSLKVVDWNQQRNRWPHLCGIPFAKLRNRTIDMLIGVDYADLHLAKTEIRGQPGQPVARLTPLGWTCVGNLSSHTQTSTHFGFFHTYFARDTEAVQMSDINLSLRRFWEIEEIAPNEAIMSAEDRRVVQRVRQSMTCNDGSYTVEIPWKDERPTVQNNYDMALQRLKHTERRLSRCPEVQESYQNTVSQYLEKGYIHKVDHPDHSDSMWFLPHFAIVRPEKATTKVRIVFDASATYKNESLNQFISPGPKLQRELFDVLLRFRKQPVAIVCDIAEMYLRIQIADPDQKYFRFLWRDMDQTRPPDIYEFSRVVFGANCSPFLAQFVSQEHARQLADEFPMAAETVLESTYMDDCMDSVSDSQRGLELYHQLTALWKRCGMYTRKWLSNSEEVMAQIHPEDRAPGYDIEIGDQLHGAKTLGVLWSHSMDVFSFRFKPVEECFVMTKRNVLKKVAALFDPLGFLAPFIVRAKILLQKMWMSGLEWDEVLDPQLKHEVAVWLSEINKYKDLHIPRCLCDSDIVREMTMHVFADASSEAYGAVAYLRCLYQTGNISTRLICARTRVAPVKSVSIPRLELMAAVLGLRLGLTVSRVLKIPSCDLVFWSDSMNVLWWIRNHSRSYKPFVANRVGEIQTASNPEQWRYVPTEMNPADLASRGTSTSKLLVEDMWFQGPEFLRQTEVSWPQTDISAMNKAAADNEQRNTNNVMTNHLFTTLLNHDYMHSALPDRLTPVRYSNWSRIVRVLAWVLRFINNCRMLVRQQGELTPEEIQESELFIIRICQQEGFAAEYQALMLQRPISPHSRISGLNPQLDEDGILRSNSRVVNADVLPYDARYPIILPRKHDVTKLIVRFEHEEGAHVSGTNQVLSELSKKYSIVSAREAIRDCENSCMACRRRKAKSAKQLMAPLPLSRLQIPEPLRCFVYTALDFAGPFLTKQGRGRCREKRYLCLFTCMSTRAVHLEMAYGLDTDSFLNAFYRFVHRRGHPAQLTSDNGRNFVGANRELAELVNQLDRNKIMKSTALQKVKWDFNPPAAPHFGGVFEIMIKAAKRAVSAILGNAEITDEELSSAFTGAEALLNSRPLTYQSASASDVTPLTPSHFLHGELGRETVPVPAPMRSISIGARWRRVQELLRHFWHRWIREWLPSLSSRKKWTSREKDLEVGDVVLVITPDTARGTWPLGRITAVHPGVDGCVRVVDVQLGKTILRRPITSLCPLEIDKL